MVFCFCTVHVRRCRFHTTLYYSTYRVVMVLVSGVAAAVVVDHFIFIPTTNPSSNDSRAQCREINGECICCDDTLCVYYCSLFVSSAFSLIATCRSLVVVLLFLVVELIPSQERQTTLVMRPTLLGASMLILQKRFTVATILPAYNARLLAHR